MEQPTFYKFPKTPHIMGSSVVDDDATISKSDLKHLCAGKTLILQEKVDGANVSVYFDEEWCPIAQKRGGIIGTGEKPQYDVFRNWCYEHSEALWKVLTNKYVLFGEWMWATHAVSYSHLPDFFIAFDVMDRQTGHFLSTRKVTQLLQGTVSLVPTLFEGTPETDDLVNFIQNLISKSKYSEELAEGIYIRFENEDRVIERCKYRRSDFTAGRDDFSYKQQNNSLAPQKE